jgi:anti-sigma B factor antagonist
VHAAHHLRDDGSTLLVLSGEIDMSCAQAIQEDGLKLLAVDGCRALVIDLMDVSFMDSTGLGALIGLRNASREMGAPLVLLDPSPRVRRVLEITRLDGVFEIGQSDPAAD